MGGEQATRVKEPAAPNAQQWQVCRSVWVPASRAPVPRHCFSAHALGPAGPSLASSLQVPDREVSENSASAPGRPLAAEYLCYRWVWVFSVVTLGPGQYRALGDARDREGYGPQRPFTPEAGGALDASAADCFTAVFPALVYPIWAHHYAQILITGRLYNLQSDFTPSQLQFAVLFSRRQDRSLHEPVFVLFCFYLSSSEMQNPCPNTLPKSIYEEV